MQNHFRRIGVTRFLAHSPDPNHPSRALSPSADSEWLGRTPAQDEKDEIIGMSLDINTGLPKVRTTADVKREERSKLFPLHYRIYDDQSQDIAEYIRAAFTEDPESIRRKDAYGFTPLYVAAAVVNVVAVRTLLELGVGSDVFDRASGDGLTPLMACEAKLRGERDFAETMLLSGWEGHREDGLRTEAMLKRAMEQGVGTDEQYIISKKWGCTCGKCAGGWLSPRTLNRLAGEWLFHCHIFARNRS
ncbi:hypothetical protein POSPLADRAFT_1152251 [Postia placenta MAD-698-R-SB12]|uniref:Uncharacterized protein n=1 Tax=Postia placenta MAD-698-R-SB12 TaxID=670580 RepID=A0A1X6MQQ4_9APHY|nr:hypothetical protein POSPLADRAFT_1152251 [Postia placenta MAD-698-R-SB12]OSX58731.1 hypothetical protein POSPLADRAFT_1152251 [Postia placenta MAD-698-R-SB12]